MENLFYEDFCSFAISDFPYEPLHGAMGEYHYRPFQAYAGQWYDPIPSMSLAKTWIITNKPGGGKCIEYAAKPLDGEDKICLLATGDPNWTNYTIEMDVRNLLFENCAGIIFHYQNSRCYYMLALQRDKVRLIKRYHTEIAYLAEASHTHDPDRFYHLCASTQNGKITCFIDGNPLFTVSDDSYLQGRIAFGALAPAQFANIHVSVTAEMEAKLSKERIDHQAIVAQKRCKYPQPKLWKAIDFKNFGCGRSIRFGHLLGNESLQIVLVQNQQRIFSDAFAHISCITAIDLNGTVLWQRGEPNSQNCHLTADLPIQIYDIDEDGYDEVICAHNFRIWVLDGRTGQEKYSAPTPLVKESPEFLNISGIQRYPYDRLNVDSIRICNLSGAKHASDLIIKDRYKRIWALNRNLDVLWTYAAPVNPGHFPFTQDVNGDGRDEVIVGYDMLDANGNRIWSLPIYTDHTDEIVIGQMDPDQGPLIGMASGFEGFNLCDLQGNLLLRQQTGHAQRISVGNYRPDLPGLEIAMVTYWGNQGILYLYDCKGRLLWTAEPSTNGNIITPVNWTGDGQDLLLLNGNCARGGMVDGFNDQVVVFPSDGHPELCTEAFDITGDARDEVLLWDEKRMFIYTQDRPFCGDKIARPEKYPHYNASNYRGEYAFPHFEPYHRAEPQIRKE